LALAFTRRRSRARRGAYIDRHEHLAHIFNPYALAHGAQSTTLCIQLCLHAKADTLFKLAIHYQRIRRRLVAQKTAGILLALQPELSTKRLLARNVY
jgi:hypothetical protein